ncbi:FtsQ-type POTRA domain-containing protein [Sporosarcina sp. Marseille-Q4063]|uniref:cell division protein FtsQ/DivIB n=1 Tax=Sporosarcina sp. Marseille-Q4063 TaxID=2810514 RepID=UPI001BB0AF3C|nr:cell division protein FtsQ/DivIB [Sporosarcina sp. Marseille-Q4063]QUW21798.1 FtsQ-type POTRA domain-containing protein [Sporosarcina sp. Marseille-Q4063]
MDKVIDIEERIPSMREKRRRRTNKKFIFILSIFALALLVILYFQSPFSKINKVTVTGANLHDSEFYIETSGLLKDKSFWGFTTKKTEEVLANLETVKKVSVSRKWLNDIDIKITEWDTVGYIEKDGQYSYLLEDGETFSSDELKPSNQAPILIGFDNSGSRKKVTKQLLELEKDVYRLISEIILNEEGHGSTDLTVYTENGYEVRAMISTFAEKMAYYPEIIAQLSDHEKGVIDMEVGTFFTPYSKVYGLSEEGDERAEEEE